MSARARSVDGRVVRGGGGRVSRGRGAPRGSVSGDLGGSTRAHTARMQRARLLAAAVGTVSELGWSGVTVAQIAGRARVSRRTFYDLFCDREDCLLGMLDDAVARVEEELRRTDLQESSWQDRVREGLWTILSFLDREPVLAGVCVVHALGGGTQVLARRQEIFGRLASILDEGRRESAHGQRTSDLTAEGLVGAAFTIVHARLSRPEGDPLTALASALMS